MKRDRIKYVLMVSSAVLLWLGAYLIFGRGNIDAIFMILPSIPLLIGGLCGIAGVFDFDYLEEKQSNGSEKRE